MSASGQNEPLPGWEERQKVVLEMGKSCDNTSSNMGYIHDNGC